MMKRAYVYNIVVDGIVRYVGKGSTTRVRAHMRLVRSIARRRAVGETVRASHFYNRLTKAWLSGAEIQEVVIADQLTDQEAYQREIAEIATAPQGQLWNYWSGGEGASRGHRLSAEQRAKIIETNRQTWSDPKLIAEQSKRMKLVWSRPEYRKTFSDAARHKSKAKSDAAKKRWADSEFRAKLGQISVDPLVKQRRSDGAKIGWIKRRSGQIGG